MVNYYNTHVAVSQAQISEVECLTRQQGTDDNSSNVWLAERRKRITSSNTGRIAKRRSSTKVANTVKQLLYSSFRGTAATQWGTLQELMARSLYKERRQSLSPNLSITVSGLVIDTINPWLGASPDNLVHESSAADPNGIVEYKNPFSIRDMLLITAAEERTKDFCLKKGQDGSLTLNHSHPYYYQIQATMFCTKRSWCDFVVRTTKDIHVERIQYDKTFWEGVLPKLRLFILMPYCLSWHVLTIHKVAFGNLQTGFRIQMYGTNLYLNSSPSKHSFQLVVKDSTPLYMYFTCLQNICCTLLECMTETM